MELSPTDRDAIIALLDRRLTSSVLRKVIHEEGVSGQRRGVERIVAEVSVPGRRPSARLPDSELSPFLVDLKGADLLLSRELRRYLAEAADTDQLQDLHDYPSTLRGRRGRAGQIMAIAERPWHPGKAWATHFVRTLAMPLVLAGLASPRYEPPTLDAEPFKPLPALEDFQDELRAAVVDILHNERGFNRGILTLPTGAGKTRTAVEALTEWLSANPERTILWVAQSEELCEQAVQAFREVWVDRGARRNPPREPLVIARLWGSGRGVRTDAAVIVASIQKLHAIFRQDDDTANRDDLKDLAALIGAIVVDEAHRALARTYGEVLRFLGVDVIDSSGSTIPLLGLTATPFRGIFEETERLAKRFHGRLLRASSLGRDPVAELRRRRVLSNPVHRVIEYGGASISLEDDARYLEHFERFNDFHPDLLQSLGQDAARNRRLIEILLDIPEDWPTLFFACSVDQATAVALILRRAGKTADVVTSSTRTATRRHRVELFRSGALGVLSNYGVLTTGFDAPLVRALIIGRPTASPVLYEQMIGRGMRGSRFGGTDECLVVDIEDNIHFKGEMAFERYAPYWTRADMR